MLRGCLVCVLRSSSSFHSFIFKLCICYDCSHIEHVHPIFCAHLIIFLGVFNLYIKFFYVYITFGVFTLCNLCVICNSNIFHSFIFKLHNDCSHIEDVHRRCRSRAEFGLVHTYTLALECSGHAWF